MILQYVDTPNIDHTIKYHFQTTIVCSENKSYLLLNSRYNHKKQVRNALHAWTVLNTMINNIRTGLQCLSSRKVHRNNRPAQKKQIIREEKKIRNKTYILWKNSGSIVLWCYYCNRTQMEYIGTVYLHKTTKRLIIPRLGEKRWIVEWYSLTIGIRVDLQFRFVECFITKYLKAVLITTLHRYMDRHITWTDWFSNNIRKTMRLYRDHSRSVDVSSVSPHFTSPLHTR